MYSMNPTSATTRRALPGKFVDILRTGDHDYGSDSDAVFAFLMSAINCGWPLTDCWLLYDSPATRLRRRKPGKNAFGYFSREYDRAAKRVADSPAAPDKSAMGEMLARIEAAWATRPDLFKGRAGATDRAVVGAMLAVAVIANSDSFGVSVRRLTELTLLTRKTVHASIERLIIKRMVTRIKAADGPDAARYRLVLVAHGHSPAEFALARSGRDLYRELPDLFSWQGIGVGPAKTWAALHEVERSDLRTIVSITGSHRTTVKRHLAKLQQFGMASEDADGWVRLMPAPEALVAISELGGIPAVRAKRKRDNEMDRAAYQLWIQDRRFYEVVADTDPEKLLDQKVTWFHTEVFVTDDGFVVDGETGEVVHEVIDPEWPSSS